MPHRLLIRFIAMLALLVSSAFSLATPALGAQAGNDGLNGDTSYTSPQFGYSVTWGSPWETRARNVTSDVGGFDALTLRDADSSLRFTGRAAGDDPATILQDAIDQASTTSTASVVQRNTAAKPLGATLTVGADTVQIEVQELPKNDAVVVIVLDAPTTTFERLLATTSGIVTLNGVPVLSGIDAGTAVATPAAATPEVATPGPSTPEIATPEIATPASSTPGIATPLPTIAASPTASPAEEPTATVAATETPTTVATPVAQSGIEGDTYTSPHFGYTLNWSDTTWQVMDGVEISQDDPAYDLVGLTAKTGNLYVYAWDAYDGNAKSCLKGEAAYYQKDAQGVSDWKLAKDANGDSITDVSSDSAWGVYNLTYTDPNDANATPQEITDYIECRPLVKGKSVLVIFASAERDTYNDHIDNVQKVIDTIDTSNSHEPGADSTPVSETNARRTI